MSKIETDRSGKMRIPRAVYVLSGAVFVLGTSEFGIAGLLPEIATDLAVSLPSAGLLISAYAIAMVIGAPALTVLTLRMPRRATLLGALGLFVAGQVLGALAGDYLTLLAARVVTAAATGAFWAASAAVVLSMVDPAHRGRALSLQMGGLTLANVLGVPLGTLVGQQLGWRATFWILAAGAALAAMAIARAVADGQPHSAPTGIRAELREFTSGRLWLALGIIAVFQTAVMSCFSYLAPLITEVAGFPAGVVPAALALFGVGSLIGVQVGGRLADAHPWATLHLGLATVLLALLALATAGAFGPVALAAALLLGAAAFASAASINARVFGLASAAPRLAGAVSASAFNIGATLGPWLGGITITAGWGFRAPSWLGAVLVAVALGLALLSRALDSRDRSDR
ncbi:MAG TPA: Cmx/CmrA family chloramphenicol efflux MFS transporter [Pseudonocardia sp.]|uniref:Cmx/CmrA family chloramphenicol efflux MFS transporter n=1 Tax=Pseudonocardia sp. TaxID=60912 RepID=UPI002CBE8B13|nr:Cmx/CmrA family chloramphenicol efflux MFS transporter [Pseudonocardia sp.]HTF50254.1 Cmx/CmrA family chloramphenicol efflux MFS transporter [Pseudonocardia sp.]